MCYASVSHGHNTRNLRLVVRLLKRSFVGFRWISVFFESFVFADQHRTPESSCGNGVSLILHFDIPVFEWLQEPVFSLPDSKNCGSKQSFHMSTLNFVFVRGRNYSSFVRRTN